MYSKAINACNQLIGASAILFNGGYSAALSAATAGHAESESSSGGYTPAG